MSTQIAKFYIVLLLLSTPAGTLVYAQFDSLKFEIGSTFMVSTKEYAPLWMLSNRYNTIEDQQIDAFIRASAILPKQNMNKWLSYSAGLDLIGKAEPQASRLQQGYLSFHFKQLSLTMGRKQGLGAEATNVLGSGSLLNSGNAMPIPKLVLAFEDYIAIPYTQGFLEVKGHFAHGWLGRESTVKGALLHEKSIYGRIGGEKPYHVYFGLKDVAQWGGTHAVEGKLPSTLSDYFKVILGQNSSDSTLIGESTNRLGNHIGLIDIGTSIDFSGSSFSAYTQVVFEDAKSFRVLNRDRLLGFSWQMKEKKLISGFTYEFLTTKYQSGPGIPDAQPWDNGNYGYAYGGRDNYYNNYLYESGWTYKGAIIGTPLFTSDAQADKYFGDYQENERNGFKFAIVNNRIIAHHLGLEGYLFEKWSYRILATYTKNWGTYGGLNGGLFQWGSKDPDYFEAYLFSPPLQQWYYMVNLEYALQSNLKISSRLALDHGDMSNVFALSVGAKWSGMLTAQKKPSH